MVQHVGIGDKSVRLLAADHQAEDARDHGQTGPAESVDTAQKHIKTK
jgi:hypothetical protein